MAPSLTLPRAVRLAIWGNACSRGVVSLDEAVDRIQGNDSQHLVAQPGEPPEALILRLAPLWRAGPGVALLPSPGFPLGLAGPPAFNAAAIEAGECVIVGTTGLVPSDDDGTVTWHVADVAPSRHVETFAEAASHFRSALQQTARTLADHDLEAIGDDVREALVGVDSSAEVELPSDLAPGMERTLVSALRCLALAPAALADHGVDLSASGAALRREALQPLDQAARRVLAAASASGPRR